MPQYTLDVNGEPRTVTVAEDTPLLWVLRDALQLTGTKFSCGMAMCGACTVHMNGAPVRSCVTPISTVAGKSVTTIEGLSADGTHPVQLAWVKHDVPQCGYCQAGHIMVAADLLERVKRPTASDIDEAFQNMICRCGTHVRIKQAILDLGAAR